MFWAAKMYKIKKIKGIILIPILCVVAVVSLLLSQVLSSLSKEIKSSRFFSHSIENKKINDERLRLLSESMDFSSFEVEKIGFIPDELSVDCQSGQFLYRAKVIHDDNSKEWVYYAERES